MNGLKNKKILMISTYGLPKDKSASNRIYGLSKALNDIGYEIYFLTCDWKKIRKNNEFDFNDFSFCKQIKLVKPTLNISILKKIRKILSLKIKETPNNNSFKNFTQNANLSIPRIESSIFNIKKFIKNGDQIIKNYKIDTVICSYGPSFVLKIGYELKKKNENVRFIADFRDELEQSSNINNFKANKYIEKISFNTFKYFDKYIFVSNGVKNKVFQHSKKYISKEEKDFKTIENGINSINFFNNKTNKTNKTNKEIINISYLGTIYNNSQNPKIIFKIANIINNLNINKKIYINYAGNSSELFDYYSKKFNLLRYYKNYGYVSKEQALNIMKNSNILLMLKYDYPEEGMLSGKIFDYITLNKKILVLGNKDKEFNLRMTKLKYIDIFDYKDFENIYNYFIDFDTEMTPIRNVEGVSYYFYENIVRRLEGFL